MHVIVAIWFIIGIIIRYLYISKLFVGKQLCYIAAIFFKEQKEY